MPNTLPPNTSHTPAPDAPATKTDTPVAMEHPRTIRSFVRRAGRVTTAQARAMAALGDTFVLPYQITPLDSKLVFGRTAPLILEIGFGMGEATAHIAALQPEHDFLGCEVHSPGVGALLKRIDEQQLGNIRICAHDAVEVLQHMLTPESLYGVHIFFPDPWHKTRHHKRRLIQPPLVRLLVSRLQPNGYIHCATDWQPYAEQILEVLSAEPGLQNTSTYAHGFADKPDYRPLTKFENRGLRLGHGVWDIVFQRVA